MTMRTARARELPEGLSNLYEMSGSWWRLFPWTYSALRRDHYQTAYACVTFDKAGKSTEHKLVVVVPRSIFSTNHAAAWDISRQLSRHMSQRRRQANKRAHG